MCAYRYKRNNNLSYKSNLSEEEKAKEAALRLLDYQDRTCSEMKRRLMEKGFSANISESVTNSLKEVGLIDDFRYASLYTQVKYNAGKGDRWIKNKLREKGIDPLIIENVLEIASEESNEEERCLIVAISLLGISDVCHIGNDGELYLDIEDSLQIFYSKISPDEKDRNLIYREKEKAKAALSRRLTNRGFTPSTVFNIIKKLDTI